MIGVRGSVWRSAVSVDAGGPGGGVSGPACATSVRIARAAMVARCGMVGPLFVRLVARISEPL